MSELEECDQCLVHYSLSAHGQSGLGKTNPVHVFIKPVMHCIEAKSDALSLPIESVAVIFCLTMISFNNLSSCLFLKVCEFITCVILF